MDTNNKKLTIVGMAPLLVHEERRKQVLLSLFRGLRASGPIELSLSDCMALILALNGIDCAISADAMGIEGEGKGTGKGKRSRKGKPWYYAKKNWN